MITHHRREDDGSLLVILPVSLTVAVGLAVATLSLSTTNLTDTNRETRKIQAYYVAKAGIEQQIERVRDLTEVAVLVNAFAGVDSLHQHRTFESESLDVGSGQVGVYDVSVRIEGRPLDGSAAPTMSNSRRFVTIRSTGYVPNKTDANAVTHSLETTVLVELSASEVFDYSYFINNWGWFYGNTIKSNGNVRSNGVFDCGNYTPTINGAPRFLGLNGTDVYGYIDDNEDGVKDGTDGGIYAGWGVKNCGNVQGMAGLADATGKKINQHEYTDQVDMPNLSNLALYEQHAVSTGSSISIGSTVVSDAVCGDNASEKQNLCLIGTTTNPIVLNGTVVVRGSLIIKGVVSGRGTIYAGGNVYVADDVTYLTPPTSVRPTENTEAGFETWLSANATKNALGLFARENIVLGDYTHSTFNSYVGSWMAHPDNQSKEDAGADGIPNTRWGRDGVPYTWDDDYLEGDGQWTVDHYTAEMAAQGLIPSGKSVGDAIPGTGEDIDGDGTYDATTTMTNLAVPAALNSTNWAGNIPAGTSAFNSIATRNIAKMDCAMYTNHTLAGYVINSGGDINFNGCIVSRNEDIVYTANNLVMNHDLRLMGGGDFFGYYLPRTFKNLRVMRVTDDVGTIHWDQVTSEPSGNVLGGSN